MAVINLEAMMEADRQGFKKGTSIFNNRPEGIIDAIGCLIGFNKKMAMKMEHGRENLPMILLGILRNEKGIKREIAKVLNRKRVDKKRERLLAGGAIKNFWLEVIDQLNKAKDEKATMEIYDKHFYQAKVTILTIMLNLIPKADHNEYILHLQMAKEREALAAYLVRKELWTADQWEEMQEAQAKFKVVTMTAQIEAGIKAGYKGSFISKCKDGIKWIDNKHHVMIWTHIILLGLAHPKRMEKCSNTENCESKKCELARATLLAACEQYEEALKSTKKIEDLKDDEEKFRKVQRAIHWAEYFCKDVEFEKIGGYENKSHDAFSVQVQRWKLFEFLVKARVFPHDENIRAPGQYYPAQPLDSEGELPVEDEGEDASLSSASAQ